MASPTADSSFNSAVYGNPEQLLPVTGEYVHGFGQAKDFLGALFGRILVFQKILAKKNPGRTGANQPGRKKSNHVAGERRPINTLQTLLRAAV